VVALLLLGCGESGAWQHPSAVRLELGPELATVVRVSWNTEAPTRGYVEYGSDGARQWSTPLETVPSRSHSQLLLGLHADTDYSVRVITWDGREAGASGVQQVRTGVLPRQLPSFDQTGEGLDGFVVLPLRSPNPGVVILDPAGQIVWYHLDESGLEPLRARLAADAQSVIYNVVSVDEASSEESAIIRVPLDGSASAATPVPFLAGDFVELPDGKLAALAVERRDDGLRSDSIVEIDTDGTTTKAWSALDCFDPAVTPGDDPTLGWTYANALTYVHSDSDPAAQSYYVGLRNFSSIVKVARGSGDCAWVLGSAGATLDFAKGVTPFVHQSGFDVYSNRVLVMDNGLPSGASRVVEYELDSEASSVTERATYGEPQEKFAGELGAATRLVDGSWFVNWASLGRLELVEKDTSLWQLSAADASFGYHTLAKTLYAGEGRRP
jgi:hypothetical protein